MKTDIVIPNYNGRIALELCIESIARHTPEPHRVIVYDDASGNPGELEYLLRAQAQGWIDCIISALSHGGHGAVLNALINTVDPDIEYIVVIDNDIQIKRSGWLSELMAQVKDPQTIIVCDDKDTFGYCSRGYRPEMFKLWFGLLNMTAYRDGMAVDWTLSEARREDEPWRSKFASLYPPEDNAVFTHYMATQWEYRIDFDREKVIFDPGAVLWAKIAYDNPKGYKAIPLTPALRSTFHHWGHAQSWLDPSNEKTPRGLAMSQQIEAELRKLRGQA